MKGRQSLIEGPLFESLSNLSVRRLCVSIAAVTGRRVRTASKIALSALSAGLQ